MFSRSMYSHISASVQLESGNTLTSSPFWILVLNSFHISGLWFFGSQACCAFLNESILSFARDFSSSLRPPPNAAVKPYLSRACLSACVFMISVYAEPWSNGLMPFLTPSSLMYSIMSSPYFFAVLSLNSIISLNFHVVFTCKNGNGGFSG